MMDDVFSRASVVHAYVGEDEYGDSRKGTKAVSLLQSITESARSPGREFKDHASATLCPFFQRPFFSRLWVVQEILLAQNVILHCGDQSTPITQDMLIKAQTHRVDIPWWMNHIGRIGPHVKSELVQVLAATALCQMSDLRDKIFGLLGLVDVEDASILAADYNLRVREVYIGTAAYLIQKKGRNDILELSESLTNIEKRNNYGIPSWVPMWDLQQRPYVAADISQRLGDIQTGINEASARIPALSLPTWPLSQPLWNRSTKSIRKNFPLSTYEIETGSGLEKCYKAVDVETGCLVTSGYEVAELKRSDFIKLSNNNTTVDEVHREVHYRVIRQGEVTLAVSGPMSTSRSTPQRVLGPSDYLALVRILGCRTFFVCDKHIRDKNVTTYKLAYPCTAAIVYTIGKQHIYSKHTEFDRACILEATYPLTLDIIALLYQWRYLMSPREEGLATCNSTDSFLAKERENATSLYVRYAIVTEIESPSVSEDELATWRLQLEEDPNWASRHESSLVDDLFTELLELQSFWDVQTFTKLANLNLKTAQDDLNYCNAVLDTFATTDHSDKQTDRRKKKLGKVEAEISSWKAAWGLLVKRFSGLISVALKQEANMFPQSVDDIFELPESWLGAYKNKQELVRLLEDRWMRCTRLLSFVIESAQCFEEAKQVMEGRRETGFLSIRV
ncbi:heterokaryon incompatibility protein het-6, partial [Fusarium langsethiae]